MWSSRIKKFLDNPLVVLSYARTHLFYRLVADRRARSYSNIKFLDGTDTLREIIAYNRSIIRIGDGTFGYIHGASIYFNDWHFRYNRTFATELKRILGEDQDERIVYCYPHKFVMMDKSDFVAAGKRSEWSIWVLAKATMSKFLRAGRTYGDSFIFHPGQGTKIDFPLLKRFLASKHVIIITSNTQRFASIKLGKTTTFVEAPRSDSWETYPSLQEKTFEIIRAQKWQADEVLLMVSAAEAAKVMVYNFTKQGYTAWDTGQFFDLAAKEISSL